MLDNETLQDIENRAALEAAHSLAKMRDNSKALDEIQVDSHPKACPLSPKTVGDIHNEAFEGVDFSEFKKYFESSAAHEFAALVWPEHYNSFADFE